MECRHPHRAFRCPPAFPRPLRSPRSPPPHTEIDEIGASYTYEKRVTKAGTGEQGFADVWKRGWFAWEYKSKGGDLKRAYRQLNEYHESLENPPLLIVCDFTRFEVHTKFENAPSRVFAFTLDDLLVPHDTATSALPPLDVLRHVFGDYNKLRPEVVAIPVTRAAASDFLRLAQRLETERTNAPQHPSKEEIAHFLMRLVFCLFADSIDLLPDHTFRTLVRNHRFSPISFNRALPHLFQAMSEPSSFFGPTNIPYFNGGLFRDNTILPLDVADLAILYSAAQHDWSHIEPAIFGTLFERSLDSAKRSMIGAHYTSPEDILLLVEPVVMAPLYRRWDEVRTAALAALAQEPPLNKDGRLHASLRANRPALLVLQNWAAELCRIRILDPACGSGNFLYIALKRLLDLWQQARVFALAHGLALAPEPIPSPTQLFGIEIDFYAHEIASIVVWIGFLQWKRDHGEKFEREPLLQPLTNIQHADAILRYNAEGEPYEPEWPPAEFIIGNPPFLGGGFLRRELGDAYIDDLFTLYKGQVRAGSDLVVYWFEKARQQLESYQVNRAALLATQGIRGGANRAVLERIQQTGRIFWAWADRKWTLQGAAVRVSMVGFERKSETNVGAPGLASETWVPEVPYQLDGQSVSVINADLTSGSNTSAAVRLLENGKICFMGPSAKAPFDVSSDVARRMLDRPLNVNGRPNRDVILPVMSGTDIVGRRRNLFTIYFGIEMSEEEVAFYEMPFDYVRHRVLPQRTKSQREQYRQRWWLYARPRPEMTKALSGLQRFIATAATAKHRVFIWVEKGVLCNQGTLVFAREDDYFFGVLQSSIHELWALAQGTQLEDRPRYTPNSTFSTFPFPWPPGAEPSEADSRIVRAIADAARELVRLRDAWLNPPDIAEADLRKRTLTNLYNQRPTWLANAHRTLDRAVFAAYGWPEPELDTQQILARLLALNHQRAAIQAATQPAVKATTPPRPRASRSLKGTASAEPSK